MWNTYSTQQVTSMNRFLYQDRFFEQPRDESYYLSDIPAEIDDNIRNSIHSLTHYEIQQLRENRILAINVYGRMVFREMLLSPDVEFRGDVRYCDALIPKREWSQILNSPYQIYSDTVNEIMYEFVIRRGSAISPMDEINLFGFIKDTRIVYCGGSRSGSGSSGSGSGSGDDDSWENHHEYAFIADVFSIADHGIDDEYIGQYGSYNMTEGRISPAELVIPFSQIRRLYRMRGCENGMIME